MKAKKAVKQLERRLRDDPENLALRIKLAGALRDAGRTADATAMYRAVALAYQRQGRLAQAAAVCRSALEIEPQQPETLELLRQLEMARSNQQERALTEVREDRLSLPSLNPQPPGAPRRSSGPPARRSSNPSRPGAGPAAERKRFTRPSNEPRRRRDSTLQPPKKMDSRPPGVPGPPGESPRPTTLAPSYQAPPPTPKPPLHRGRSLPDVPIPTTSDDFDDAATRVAGDPGQVPGAWPVSQQSLEGLTELASSEIDDAAQTVVHLGPTGAGESGHDSMTQIFGRSFQSALDGLAPDGSAIDVPLGVFSDLPSDVLDQLVRGMSLRTAEPGEILVREGEIGDACFVIASGEVRVLKREPTNPHGAPIEVARLGHGAVFGEFALLADRRRHATVEVLTPTELFEIPRRLASELAASYPEVRPALERFYRERLVSTLLTTTPLFRPLPAERRADVLAHFHPRRSESGEAIVREGEPAGGLYLIVLGQVEITKRVAQRRSVLLATLGEGAYFGEMSLLQGEPASASVTATGPTELAVLPADSFYELVAEYPVLWESMKREAGRRDLETHRIVAGNTSVV